VQNILRIVPDYERRSQIEEMNSDDFEEFAEHEERPLE